jgi:hypothetical protein
MSDAIEHLANVRARPAFRAFSSLIGSRIENGRALEALRMLVAVGASPEVAHDIVDGWPEDGTRRLPGLVLGEEAACWLACFAGDLAASNWPNVLVHATERAGQAVDVSQAEIAKSR